MKKKEIKKFWVVVKVWRGIPVKAKGFVLETSAQRRARIWESCSNRDYDEVGVFKVGLS